jgi:uncharacterized protein YukE
MGTSWRSPARGRHELGAPALVNSPVVEDRVAVSARKGGGDGLGEDNGRGLHDDARRAPRSGTGRGGSAADAVILPTPTVLSKKELTLERLHEGYQKVIGLVESIQVHLDKQDQRGESMTKAMQSLADQMRPVNESANEQLRVLGEMNGRISELPRLAQAQNEVITTIGLHLEATSQTQDRISSTLDGFQRAVTHLGDATNASSTAFRQMHADSSAREERMARVLQDQTRRFTWIASMAITIAVVSAAISAVALLR